jgi:uncharacterized protein (TIGR02246 family)
MALAKNASLEEIRIRDMMDEWVEAFETKDLDRIMSLYADDVVAYDLMPPLQYRGKDAYRKVWQDGLSMMRGELRVEIHDQHVSVDEELAYGHILSHFQGKDLDGNDIDVWSRVTDCYRKIEGRWLVTHEHTSVPIDMKTGKGMMDLRP